MCGIAGALIYDAKIAKLDNLLSAVKLSSKRGRDSFGIIRWSKSTGFQSYYTYQKLDKDWLDIIGSPERSELTFYIHTARAEPTTEWNDEKIYGAIPPFESDGYAVAHNGIISNDKELIKEFDLKPTSKIDTVILPQLMAKIGVWETINKLKSGNALAIINSKSQYLILYRNFLPLVISWQPGIVCFASEREFFPDYDQPFKNYQLWEMPYYSGISFCRDGYSWFFEKEEPWIPHLNFYPQV